jgi:hypothetical protein
LLTTPIYSLDRHAEILPALEQDDAIKVYVELQG